ncbi:MSMEG_0567/sll0787 family protein [Williamsia herbipolensis]|uniref:MSMEG_0567/sll0787 family protein n=1 Tax=Williamsia herbipolensis TaxID=1603258 RepID=UPI000697EE6E|nr:MSMEG_0567/sll0787 family protein [Williamsia herbipolensis]
MRPPTAEMSILSGLPRGLDATRVGFLITPATSSAHHDAYRKMRREAFVDEQKVFSGSDIDDVDDDPRTLVLVAVTPEGTVVGGVRLAPQHGWGIDHRSGIDTADIGWWTGSRLVVDRSRHDVGIGPALVRAACAHASERGVLRFEATVQRPHRRMFAHLGWDDVGVCEIGGRPHVRMRWDPRRIERVAERTKSFLAEALAPFRQQPGGLGPAGFTGDDGVPVPGSDIVAACDAILPSMVDRDPEWAGWCSVLVNLNDLAAMGATPTGLLDAVGATTRSQLTRIVRGMAGAASAWGVPVLGGHTQLGVPASLSVTALGTTRRPVPAGGADVGDHLRVTVDVSGGWRPGYHGGQWDSTSTRAPHDLRAMNAMVRDLSPRAAKDVSMAGIAGTTGMLAEACGTGAEIDVAAVPRPGGVDMGSWLTCFPGFAMLTADRAGTAAPTGLPRDVETAVCGRLTATPGVRLRWPDGVTTTAVNSGVTGLGRA